MKREILRNTLILIAPESDIKKGTKPISNRTEPTIAELYYEILTENPYTLTYDELMKEVHVNRRGKEGLKLHTYRIRRAELCKIWGWGIHGDENEKLALVGSETKRYRDLVRDSKVKKEKALNPPQAQVLARDKLLKKSSAETKVFQLRLDSDLYEWMDEHVNLNHKTKADLIRELLKEYREKENQKVT